MTKLKRVSSNPGITTLACVKRRCVVNDEGCHSWALGVNSRDVPVASIRGGNCVSVRRFVANEHFGEQRMTGKRVRLTCDNPLCLNPSHMRVTTVSAIYQAAYKAGRTFKPGAIINMSIAARKRAKLGTEDARAIRAAKGVSPAHAVAAQYGVTKSAVQKIWANKIWREASSNNHIFSMRG